MGGGGVVGFSYKDLIADGFGVLSSIVTGENLVVFADYDTWDEELTVNFAWRF